MVRLCCVGSLHMYICCHDLCLEDSRFTFLSFTGLFAIARKPKCHFHFVKAVKKLTCDPKVPFLLWARDSCYRISGCLVGFTIVPFHM